jgi:TolB protein
MPMPAVTPHHRPLAHPARPHRRRLGALVAPAMRRLVLVAAVLLPLAGAAPALAQREPVLKQIDVPHPYYFREMYLPQATSGPSAVAWSPDGKELALSMQGSLWRHHLGSDVAEQLTNGPGYDYQPDWSSDGRYLVYASYQNDAVELWLLDLTDGRIRALTTNGAVNVEPRWSPDGTRIAFVSTVDHRRWHLFTIEVRDGQPGGITQLTEENDSGLPRYYYSVFDHEISPAWSPDGRELLFVSNRGHIWGTGGVWRMKARPGARAREIHYEETNWKARPDWSPDGRRVVYSSYLGRQWNQLWLMTADGGDVFQLTYGDYDATAPRWSPDGRHIAYISNQDGDTSLWILEIPGGARHRVTFKERRPLGPSGRLRLEVFDAASGRPAPARVSVTGPDGRGFAPDDAWRHADDSFDRSERRFETTYFHTAGASELTLPAGRVTVEVMRGLRYRLFRREVTVPAGGTITLRVPLERLADLVARGWRDGDLHVHMNYGGAYRNDPKHLALQMQAEGLSVVEDLIVNKEQRIPDFEYPVGIDPVSGRDLILAHGQEFHTSYWGHTALIGLTDHLLLPDYAGYVNTAAASLYPDNTVVYDLAHEQGALLGYVHPFDTAPDPFNTAEPLTHEVPVSAALGRMDYYEVLGFSEHRITAGIWHRLLDCGFRIPAGAGTDAMANFASLRGPVGLVRVFVHTGATFTHDRFLEGLKEGRTFATNAPLLEFTLDGKEPGDEIRRAAVGGTLRAKLSMRSIVPIDHLEIVGREGVVAAIPLQGDRTRADATVEVPVKGSGWYALQAGSERATHPVLDLYPFGTTSPIYVSVADEPVRSAEDARFFLAWVDRLIAAAREHQGWNGAEEKATVLRTLQDARQVFDGLAREEPGTIPPGS